MQQSVLPWPIGDWKDAKGKIDEAPITLRYAEGKEGKGRSCKLICAALFASLAKENIQTFDEITVQKWDVMAGEAKTKVESRPPRGEF